jgi:plasmid stabilization system protein ParE
VTRPTVELHPGAIEDIEQGRNWYADRNPVVAEAFIAEVDHAMFLIAEAPNRWPRRHGDSRSYVLPGLPYTVCYLEMVLETGNLRSTGLTLLSEVSAQGSKK